MAIKIVMPKPKTTTRSGEPTPAYTGRRAGIMFSEGVGYSETALNEGQRFNFARWGYTVSGEADDDAAKSSSRSDTGKAGVVKGGTSGGKD